MSEKEITELIVNQISENLFKVIGILFTSLGVIVSSTWFVCKKWYQREINHLKDTKTSECSILKERIEYLTQKLNDNNLYAKGIIEVAKHQLTDDNLKNLGDKSLVSEYESKIKKITEEYNNQILSLTQEKEELYEMLKSSKTDKSEMIDRLNFVVLYLGQFDYGDNFSHHINHCYSDLVKNQNDNDFYVIYSKYSLLISTYFIYSLENLKKDKKILESKFFTNRIDNLNHTIKIIKPFIFEEGKDTILLKTLIDKYIQSLNNKNSTDIDKNEDEK